MHMHIEFHEINGFKGEIFDSAHSFVQTYHALAMQISRPPIFHLRNATC